MQPGPTLLESGVLYIIYQGVKSSVFPCLIFLGVGAMTDFGPLLANPSSLLLGGAAQLGIYVAFVISIATGLFTPAQAAAIGIIGGADGPTAIFLATGSPLNWLANCGCRLFLHGAHPANSAPDHAFADHQKRA